MAHITLDPARFTPRPGMLTKALLAASRRVAGADLDTVQAMAHRTGVLLPWTLLEAGTMRMRSVLPGRLAELVVFVTAQRIGCSWCVDYSSALWQQQGLDPQLLVAAGNWRAHPNSFDDVQRAAFGYAEQVTDDPGTVTDDEAAFLRERLGEAGLVELTYWIALENMRSRFNGALGLRSQGFSDACALPSPSA